MDIYELINKRKSVRAYLDTPVEENLLKRILEGAHMAPSASNRQEWRFVVVRDSATRQRLAVAAKNQKFLAEAPVVIACCAETENYVMACGQMSYPIDVAIAIDHLTLCAAAEGLGTCWIGAFDEQEVKEILNIPDSIRVVELLPLGYPRDPATATKVRKPLPEIVQYESWDQDRG
jgi:nitroreductase